VRSDPARPATPTWGRRNRTPCPAAAGSATLPAVTDPADERTGQFLHAADQSAWSLAALSLVLGNGGTAELRRSAQELVRVLGLDTGAHPERGRALAGQAAAPLLQTAALLGGGFDAWAGQTDEALLAQGRASAQGAPLFARFVFPGLPGLTDALSQPGARMLDVGTGVAAMAVAYAELWPELTVVGLDVLPRALALAAVTVAGSAVADRVVVREQDVATLDEASTYHLAWLPAPFVPEAAVRAGIRAINRAVVPGGWVMIGHGKFTGEPLDDAITRFKTVVYGGTALDDDEAAGLLRDAGFDDVRTVATPPGAPGITVGRRPG
jgi:SAM-dependent methyltransferase